jgi:hypothetical protein
MNINPKEAALVVKCLETASDLFSNHGCNDTPDEWFSDWTKEELVEFDRQYNEWNTSPEEHDPEDPWAHKIDFAIMSFLASKIESEIK